jgi:hypothetical protein
MENEKNEYARINSGLAWEMGLDYNITEHGIVANYNFLEKLSDFNKYFNLALLEPVKNILGNNGWAIMFVQISAYENSFFCDIYVDNREDFNTIMQLIESNIAKEFKLSYYYKGVVANYLKP